MEEPALWATVKLLAPSLILLATAASVAVLLRGAQVQAGCPRAAAVLGLLAASLIASLQLGATARLASLPLGAVSAPMIELRQTALSLSWLQLLLFSSAALILASPHGSLPALLLLLAVAAPSLLAGSFPAVCLFWFTTEIALALYRAATRAKPGHAFAAAGALLPPVLGTAAVLAAFHASASDEALVLSLGSLRGPSWLLLVAAVALRLRPWSPAGPLASYGASQESARTGAVAALLVAGTTGFFTLSRLDMTPRPGQPPQSVVLVLLVLSVGTAALAWAHRRAWPGVVLWSTGALLTTTLLPATLAFPPAAWVGPAAAHILAALVACTTVSLLPWPPWSPRKLPGLVMAVVGFSLLPWPVFPYGRAVTWGLDLLAGFRPAGAVLLALTAGLPAAALLAGQRGRRHLVGNSRADAATTLVGLLVVGVSAALVLGAGSQNSAQALFAGDHPSPGVLALALLGASLGLLLTVADRAGILAPLDTELLTRPRPTAPAWVRDAPGAISGGVELVFRFLEGETPLTWTVLIGTAILILAAG
ncbi:MAG: hypothetical protein HPY83_00900 [Anaerolineae bacterium]|nr:hypothetical protein [Anaerolineae bacterium]